MQKINSEPIFTCPQHPDRNIEKFDPNPFAVKQVYCVDCILDDPQAHTLNKSLLTRSAFLDRIAASFAGQKAKIRLDPNLPQEYLQFISGKAERLERLTKHISDQKKIIEEVIDEIKTLIEEALNRKRAELLERLDKQVNFMSENYDQFERRLKIFYPRQEDLGLLFPSRDELDIKLKQIENSMQLELFVKKMNQEVEESRSFLQNCLLNDVSKKLNLDSLKNQLGAVMNPCFNINLQVIKDELMTTFNSSIEKGFEMKGIIPNILDERLLTVFEWLPEEYQKTFKPKLIFKGTRDGMTPEAFSSCCYNKGPTISFITCKFDGAQENSVIGGFLDKDWEKNGGYISSNQAFIFSLTPKIKCPISEPSYAVYEHQNFLLVFGLEGDITIPRDLKTSYMHPQSYINSSKMVQSPNYDGKSKVTFMPIEVEVYSLRS